MTLQVFLLDHIIQPITFKIFRPKENGQRVECEKELHWVRKEHSVGTIEPPTGLNRSAVDNNLLF